MQTYEIKRGINDELTNFLESIKSIQLLSTFIIPVKKKVKRN